MAFQLEKYQLQQTILVDLSKQDSALLKKHLIQMNVSKNELLYSEGSYSKGLYILEKGKVKIFQVNKSGDEQIVYIYTKGDILGYRPLLCNTVHPVSALAIEDSTLSLLPEQYFNSALDQSPVLAKRFLVNLAFEFGVWINTLIVLTQQPVRERVAFILLLLDAKFRKSEKSIPQSVNISRENFANYARTTIETVARILSSFKEDGIVEIRGRKIFLLDREKLMEIADFD